MKALVLVNNNSGFACDDCIFKKDNGSCRRDDYIIELLGDCDCTSIYQVDEVGVENDITI